jgi:hypothetical protein
MLLPVAYYHSCEPSMSALAHDIALVLGIKFRTFHNLNTVIFPGVSIVRVECYYLGTNANVNSTWLICKYNTLISGG